MPLPQVTIPRRPCLLNGIAVIAVSVLPRGVSPHCLCPPPRRTKSLPQRARDVSTSRQRVRRHQPSQPVPPLEIARTRKTALLGSTGQLRRRELQGALHQTAPRAVDRPSHPTSRGCRVRRDIAPVRAPTSRLRCRAVSQCHRVRGLETTTSVSMSRPRPRCLADSRPRPRHQCRPHLRIEAADSRPRPWH